MNTNDLVYKVAARVRELADKSLPELRFAITEAGEPGDSFDTVNRNLRHRKRGDLIEEIITEEFCEEHPKDIADDEETPSRLELREALEKAVHFGFCPDCGCDLANTPGCTWCGIITAQRAVLAKEKLRAVR